MTYEAAYEYLLSLPRFATQGARAAQWGLERMEMLMRAMEQPHKRFKSIHIAGTNGKGSTASMIAAIGSASGYRMGLHTSPHLWHVGERMRIDGVAASESWLTTAITRYVEVFEEVQPSFFEATVALSFLFFAEHTVDYAVVEVGLGGRLDATNILHPVLTVITSIGLDHTAILGETHAAIARAKAGIVKPHVPLLTPPERPDVTVVFEAVCQAQEAPWYPIGEEMSIQVEAVYADRLLLNVETPVRAYTNVSVGVTGVHQQINAALAIRAAELAFPVVAADGRPVYNGLAQVRRLSGMRGRLDVIQNVPLVLTDVAHNEDSLAATLLFAEQEAKKRNGRLMVVFGAMGDKALGAMVAQFRGRVHQVWVVPLEGERAAGVVSLHTILAAHDVYAVSAETVPEAIAAFSDSATADDVLLVTGSHQVVAQLVPN